MITQLHRTCISSIRRLKLQRQNFSSNSYGKYQSHNLFGKLIDKLKIDNIKLLSSSTISAPQIKISSSQSNYIIGQTYHDFMCIRNEYISDFNMQAYIFRHNKIGSEFVYLKRNDPNKVFSINFRTTPFDSSGLPHILEHLVLCGSQKYPVRDPFFKMLNRSIATFMNAMTGPDYTMYPFSTTNECDFYNLQKIYLDAVFKPNLKYLDFLQEGWRLEHSNNKDRNSDIQIKGVVYNEMKGAFSENSIIFMQQLLNSILPDTYGYVSGGNPLEIPKLTHDDLIKFHKKYYHPSNAKFFCYGNLNLDKTLSYINNEYLLKYDKINPSYSRILNHKRWMEQKNVHVSCRYDNVGAPFEKQNQIAITLLLSDITNSYETFILYVITELLVKGPNSYFYKSLIEPNFSGGYNQVTGYNSDTKDTYFTVGLQDLKVDDFSRVENIFNTTIQEAYDNGFNLDHIESVLHSIELSLKHQTSKFGLNLLFNISPILNHDGDIIETLNYNILINKLRNNIKMNKNYLQQKIERYFKNNTHKLILTMSPDENYEMKFKEAEQLLIKEKLSNLNDNDKLKIYEDCIKLENEQKQLIDNINLLPCLKMNDIKESPNEYDLHITRIKNLIPTQICTVDTNNINYIKLLFDAGNLNDEQIKLIPLFTNIITEMGTKNYDYCTFDKILTSKTSGINIDLYFNENIYDFKTYNLGILLSSYSLDNNQNYMLNLINELLNNFKFDDEKRLKMLIENYLSNISTGIAQSGHIYAMQCSNGLITDSSKLKSILCGIEHIDYMKNLINKKSYKNIMLDLEELGKNLFNVNRMRTALNMNDELLPNFIKNYENFINNLQQQKPQQNLKEYKFIEKNINLLEPSCQHFIMNVPVNYCAKSFLTVPITHRDHPGLSLLAKILTSKYLLPVVRERNGAYGAGAKLNINGIFNFYSYRDPNSIQTLNTFDNTYQWLIDNYKNNLINNDTLFEAKLGVLQQLDMPKSPDNKGIDFFLYGISQDMLKKYRERMLNVTLDELKLLINKYFENKPKYYGKCILGPENNNLPIKDENWKIIAGN